MEFRRACGATTAQSRRQSVLSVFHARSDFCEKNVAFLKWRVAFLHFAPSLCLVGNESTGLFFYEPHRNKRNERIIADIGAKTARIDLSNLKQSPHGTFHCL